MCENTETHKTRPPIFSVCAGRAGVDSPSYMKTTTQSSSAVNTYRYKADIGSQSSSDLAG